VNGGLASWKYSRSWGRMARMARARCERWFLGPMPASANVMPSSGAKKSGS